MSHHSSSIRNLCNEAKDAFQALHDAVKGSSAGKTGKTDSKSEAKPAARNGSFEPNEFIQHKCEAAIALLAGGTQPVRSQSKDELKKMVHDLQGLFREFLAAYRGARFEQHNKELDAIYSALHRLCWAVEGENRLALVEICDSVKKLKAVFESVDAELNSDVGRLWTSGAAQSKTSTSAEGRPKGDDKSDPQHQAKEEEAECHDGDAMAIAQELCALCDECEKGATAAIDAICDSDKLRALMDNVCRFLTGIQQRYDHLRCVLHLRECQPDMQPPQTAMLLEKLEQSGAEVARLARAGRQLAMKQPDVGRDLRENWKSLRECMEHVRADLVDWAECQSAAPDGCFKSVGALIELAAQGSKLVESTSSICCETLSGICKLADQFDIALRQLDCQLEKLNDFPKGATGCCWWKLVRIQVICQCPPADDCCSDLKTEVTRLMEQFQSRKPESPSELMKAVNVGRILQLAMECFGRAARGECVEVCTHKSSGVAGKKEMPAISMAPATSQTKLAQYWAKSDEICKRMAQCPELAGFTKQWARFPKEQATFLEAHGNSLPGAIEMSQARRQSFVTAGSTALRLVEASVPSASRGPITKLRIQFEEQY